MDRNGPRYLQVHETSGMIFFQQKWIPKNEIQTMKIKFNIGTFEPKCIQKDELPTGKGMEVHVEIRDWHGQC